MSELLKAQAAHTQMVAHLLIEAAAKGYLVTWGDAYRDPRVFGAMGVREGYGEANSAHKQRLAVDLNLFDKDGKYLAATEDHKPLGLFWESIGGTWGGRFRSGSDGNHYSLAFGGIA
jgi:hypothetical protein